MCEICFLWIGSHFDFAVRWCEVCNQETFAAAPIYSPPARIFQEFSEFPRPSSFLVSRPCTSWAKRKKINMNAKKHNSRINKVNNLHYYNKSDVSAPCGLTKCSKNSCLESLEYQLWVQIRVTRKNADVYMTVQSLQSNTWSVWSDVG